MSNSKSRGHGRFVLIEIPNGWITRKASVCGGDPCVDDTRLPVWSLELARRQGCTEAYLLEAYPQLTREGLQAAWDYAERHKEEVDRLIRENEEP